MIQPWKEITPSEQQKKQSKFANALRMAAVVRLSRLRANSECRPWLSKWRASTTEWKQKIRCGSVVRSVVTLENSSALVCGNVVWSRLNNMAKLSGAASTTSSSSSTSASSAATTSSHSSTSSTRVSGRKRKGRSTLNSSPAAPAAALWWPCQLQYPHDPSDTLITSQRARLLGKYKVQPLGADQEGGRFHSTW